jgi:hypothetical protein
MVKATAELICDCEATTQFDYREPGTLSPVTRQVTCQKCRSIFTFRFMKTVSGVVKYSMSLSAASRSLAEHIARKEQAERANAPQKKAPSIFLPGDRN